MCVCVRACDISLDISWSQQDNRTALPPDVSDLKPAAKVQWRTSRLLTPREAEPRLSEPLVCKWQPSSVSAQLCRCDCVMRYCELAVVSGSGQ